MKREKIIEVLKKYFNYEDFNVTINNIADELQAKEVTDDMIEKWILKHHSFRTYTWKCACIIGAKAHRDNLI